ncbi:Ribosomal protein L35Ae family protein [Perilla frutescens var. hirtella]|nr:Ribosomal protein L35Ae family protein [Perilla frutescens var. hirtella]
MVKGRQGENVRLYVRGTILGYKRSKSNQYPNTSLIQIEGVNMQEEVGWYLGKRMAYIYKAMVKKSGSHYRCIWGKVTHPHGNSGVVRAKFKSNLSPKSMGARIFLLMMKMGYFSVEKLHCKIGKVAGALETINRRDAKNGLYQSTNKVVAMLEMNGILKIAYVGNCGVRAIRKDSIETNTPKSNGKAHASDATGLALNPFNYISCATENYVALRLAILIVLSLLIPKIKGFKKFDDVHYLLLVHLIRD